MSPHVFPGFFIQRMGIAVMSLLLYRALRDNNVPVQFIGCPGPGHSPGDPIRQRDVNRRWIEWLNARLSVPLAP